MKKFFLFGICILTGFGYVHAQQKNSADERSVQETVAAMFDALAKGDTATIKLYCTKDILILEDKEVWILDTLNNKVIQYKDTGVIRVNRMDFIETKIEGKIAWTSYYNQANISRRGKQIMVRWLETAILIKENNKWKMRVLHSTTIERK